MDDEQILLSITRRVLSPHYDVVACERAEDALALVLGGERFDLVLSDLMMPGMNGMELLAELSARAPDLAGRFVFMTGGAFTPETRQFLATMEEHVIDKPFDPARLRALVAEHLG